MPLADLCNSPWYWSIYPTNQEECAFYDPAHSKVVGVGTSSVLQRDPTVTLSLVMGRRPVHTNDYSGCQHHCLRLSLTGRRCKPTLPPDQVNAHTKGQISRSGMCFSLVSQLSFRKSNPTSSPSGLPMRLYVLERAHCIIINLL